MTFIAIVIFTVYTKSMVYTDQCDPTYSTTVPGGGICADYVVEKPQEEGQEVPQYVGEFPTLSSCLAAAGRAHYRLKKGETRVEDVDEVLCVPKTPQ